MLLTTQSSHRTEICCLGSIVNAVVGLRLAYALAAIYASSTGKGSSSTSVPRRPQPIKFDRTSRTSGSEVQLQFDQLGLVFMDTEDCHGSTEGDRGVPVVERAAAEVPACIYGAAEPGKAILHCCADHCYSHPTLIAAESACNADWHCSGITNSSQFKGGFQTRCGPLPPSHGSPTETSWPITNRAACHGGPAPSPTPTPPAPGPPSPPAPPTPQRACCQDDQGFELSATRDPTVFIPAHATISGSTILLRVSNDTSTLADRLSSSWSVRYAWSSFPRCVVKNAAGLPVAPFWHNSSTKVNEIKAQVQRAV